MFWNDTAYKSPHFPFLINRKHEMFWNKGLCLEFRTKKIINRKHEMFWNSSAGMSPFNDLILTVNMKCFEIFL